MRNVILPGLVMILTLLSFGSLAAEQMNAPMDASAQAITVSAGSSLSAPAHGGLNEKAVPDGSRSYPMTSVSGQHNMHSTSVVYE